MGNNIQRLTSVKINDVQLAILAQCRQSLWRKAGKISNRRSAREKALLIWYSNVFDAGSKDFLLTGIKDC